MHTHDFRPFVARLVITACIPVFLARPLAAATTAIASPADIAGGTTIHFDGLPTYTVANNFFAPQGMTFSRDDGRNIYVLDWAGLGRDTTSPGNVLATILGPGDPIGSWVTHLNLTPSLPVFAVGAYFGNDQGGPDYNFTRLSAFGDSGQLLGSVQFNVNDNISVDQFLGLRSDVAIHQIRFENFTAPGTPATSYSVVIDDLVFSPVPEPATISLVGMALLGGWFLRRHRK